MSKKSADKIMVVLQVGGDLYQVTMSETKRNLVGQLLGGLFDGPIPIAGEPLPMKILDKEQDNGTQKVCKVVFY